MIDNLKKILNEDQDPKAIEKITSKLENLLMSNEEVGYIAVQKKPAVTILPDSIVVTNKRIILCKPKNLGLSMEFIDYDWDDIAGSFVKEGILGADFTFTTNSDLTHTVDYLPKNQARKLYTYAKEQLDILKNGPKLAEIKTADENNVEEVVAEEVTHLAEILPATSLVQDTEVEVPITQGERPLTELSKEELFEKLQNYKKLLDNGLILQGEYDRLKNEIITYL
ncbi:PH domain-containing protein [Flavobacterium sp. 20NA77.7]|uniref:PH domain-containing protein n=1 Tax=Flavobacterium nakdongensis TaxID=3073563 RepID=A0ABY9RA73_9FLAO|nr:PH domain-containing protein [Flavobacterium sp. 20NA77.7]WMW78140.1 PH domain-containing protein [Flavobacterium sp. 20NA77.7]